MVRLLLFANQLMNALLMPHICQYVLPRRFEVHWIIMCVFSCFCYLILNVLEMSF